MMRAITGRALWFPKIDADDRRERQRDKRTHKLKYTPLESFGPQRGDKNITNIVYRNFFQQYT